MVVVKKKVSKSSSRYGTTKKTISKSNVVKSATNHKTKNSHQSSNNKGECQICHKMIVSDLLGHAELIHGGLLESIKRKVPNWDSSGFICVSDLKTFRESYIENLIKVEKGELSKIEKDILKSLKEQELLSKNVDEEYDGSISFGERLSDKIAEVGGSWHFLIFFGLFILVWFILNTVLLINGPFDPYPFILLNLVLSCLAAVQAPIIMMSQNRQEAKDRLHSQYDYQINMKAELEIRHLHEKLDQLLNHQWKRLIDIQKMQMDLIEEVRKKK